mmetsp:Transcript_16049/g.51326  ORF Transcript_16049/g.51326 Transcript_16049/m.51326 type:complete len:306 (-) Transcript_16049:1202-2119(-)
MSPGIQLATAITHDLSKHKKGLSAARRGRHCRSAKRPARGSRSVAQARRMLSIRPVRFVSIVVVVVVVVFVAALAVATVRDSIGCILYVGGKRTIDHRPAARNQKLGQAATDVGEPYCPAHPRHGESRRKQNGQVGGGGPQDAEVLRRQNGFIDDKDREYHVRQQLEDQHKPLQDHVREDAGIMKTPVKIDQPDRRQHEVHAVHAFQHDSAAEVTRNQVHGHSCLEGDHCKPTVHGEAVEVDACIASLAEIRGRHPGADETADGPIDIFELIADLSPDVRGVIGTRALSVEDRPFVAFLQLVALL